MKLCIYGSSGAGREVFEIANRINLKGGIWKEILFIDDFREDSNLLGSRIIRFKDLSRNDVELEVVIAVGEPEFRMDLFKKIEGLGLKITSLIDPSAVVSKSCIINKGCIIYANAIISCDVKLNENVMIQFNSVVGHDIDIGAHSVVSSRVIIGGGVTIGERAFVGMGASIKEKCSVGNQSILGMGSNLFTNIGASVIAIGNPARIIRRNDELRVFK